MTPSRKAVTTTTGSAGKRLPTTRQRGSVSAARQAKIDERRARDRVHALRLG